MSALREVGLTALREIRRNLRSTKGIAMVVLFVLGGAAPSVLELFAARFMGQAGIDKVPPEAQREMLEKGLNHVYQDEALAHHLSYCPPLLLLLLRGTFFLLPVPVLMIAFDIIAGEIQHRSIRYLAFRARRDSIVAGKALGAWAVIALMVLVLHVTVWTAMLFTGRTPAADIASWGPRVWLFSVADAAAYVGLTVLMSSWFKTPILALLINASVLFVLWLANALFGFFEATHALTWAFPSTYESLLVSPEPARVAGGVVALLAWGAACVAGAAAIVRRRDI